MIKSLRFIVPLLLCFSVSVSAQKSSIKFVVTENKLNTEKGEQPAYIIHIPDAGPDAVTKEWLKAIRGSSKSKPVQIENKIEITATEIEQIHDQPFNIYSMVYQVDTSVRVVAAFEIDSVFFVPPGDESDHEAMKTHNHIRKFMEDFAREQYHEVVANLLETEKDKLKDLEKEHKNEVKENENLKKEIRENEQNIRNSNDAITTYENDNARLLADITAKRDAIAGLSGDEALRDQAKDQLKSLEKEKKNIEGKLAKEQKNIVKYESNIEELNRQVEANEKQQETTRVSIEAQKERVKQVSDHLNQI
ncbi:MAG TPA: hypothetical protein P5514_12230 [Bacteroidales bacterium]|nr:hypothetical protein [Bacteroidales bacterium]HPE57143.1 hypothetical protein [Bacteroidales bacterium]HRX97706.1 hypothetical protein [Bacteroidales bacterium]